ncbi:hypothetical protein [uncultured Brachyspira sp.]|uniref:hypothetical protein n=4 Tax=uncultured Brachyspira sp. TaxID=221953 RepID=UPI0025EC0118|nr:hypothetical protein [uncultured Brachyspira sp.]
MKKILIRLFITLFISFIISILLYMINIFIIKYSNVDIATNNILDVLFTVIGILFSVGYSIIIGFSLRDIKNEKYINRFKTNLNNISITLSVYFTTSIIIYMISKLEILKDFDNIYFFIKIYSTLILSYIILFLTYNFYIIQKTKLQIEEQITKEINIK